MVNLHAKYAQEGFDIVAFPTDEFGGQELRTNQEIKDFVANYGVEFTMMDKTKVNPPGESERLQLLEERLQGLRRQHVSGHTRAERRRGGD